MLVSSAFLVLTNVFPCRRWLVIDTFIFIPISFWIALDFLFSWSRLKRTVKVKFQEKENTV